MTKKRFTTDNGSHEDVCLVDNLTKKEYESNFEDMVSLMNDIWNQTQRFEKHNQRLEKENEQLKQRNNNQYNQLTELWQIIEEENWEALTEMDNQMKKEEVLRNEWKYYEWLKNG